MSKKTLTNLGPNSVYVECSGVTTEVKSGESYTSGMEIYARCKENTSDVRVLEIAQDHANEEAKTQTVVGSVLGYFSYLLNRRIEK